MVVRFKSHNLDRYGERFVTNPWWKGAWREACARGFLPYDHTVRDGIKRVIGHHQLHRHTGDIVDGKIVPDTSYDYIDMSDEEAVLFAIKWGPQE